MLRGLHDAPSPEQPACLLYPRIFVAKSLALLLTIFLGQSNAETCASCHPNEVAGFESSSMAHSISPVRSQPDGKFEHPASRTLFSVRRLQDGAQQSWERERILATLPVAYAIGSGNHAVGYLLQVGNHLFQSPISYYTNRRAYDMAPGYEQASRPDFTRPVTVECLACHVNKPLPLPDTLNSYRSPPLAGLSISCERCHGSAAAHLKNPLPGSIVNPAKLSGAPRDSICEQCHLAGDVRIPNPGKTPLDFTPGERTEDVFTVFLGSDSLERGLKVISHSEQLALSACARGSVGRLWCGTCHNPHDEPAQPAAYYRERCLSCHAATLTAAHAAPDRNCVACHMPRLPAKDGGHTAFTDHRIAREPSVDAPPQSFRAWRQPAPQFRDRNLALALVALGLENSNSEQVIRGYKLLNKMNLQNDPAALTSLGSVLLTAKQPQEAAKNFAAALALRPNYAPYEVNVASALFAQSQIAAATEHLEHAIALDPLLQQAVDLLSEAYRRQGFTAKAHQLSARFNAALGVSATDNVRPK